MTIIQREASLGVLCSVNSHIPGFLPLPNFFLVPYTLLFSHLLLIFYFLLFFPLFLIFLSSPLHHHITESYLQAWEQLRRKIQERKSESPELPLKLNTTLASVIGLFIILFLFLSPHPLPLEISQALSILILLKKWD